MDKELIKELPNRLFKFKIDDENVLSTAQNLINNTDNGRVCSGRFPKLEILDYHIYFACRICEYPVSISEINHRRKKEKKQPLSVTVLDILKSVVSEMEGYEMKPLPMDKYLERALVEMEADPPMKAAFMTFYKKHENVFKHRAENMVAAVCLYHAKIVSGFNLTLEKIMRNFHVSRDGVRNFYKELVDDGY